MQISHCEGVLAQAHEAHKGQVLVAAHPGITALWLLVKAKNTSFNVYSTVFTVFYRTDTKWKMESGMSALGFRNKALHVQLEQRRCFTINIGPGDQAKQRLHFVFSKNGGDMRPG